MIPEVRTYVQQENPRCHSKPAFADFIAPQALHSTCQYWGISVSCPDQKFYVDSDFLLVRQSTVDDTIPIIRTEVFKTLLLCLAYHQTLAGYRGKCRVLSPMNLDYYRSQMVNDIQRAKQHCQPFAKRRALMNRQRHLALFLPSTSLKIIFVEIPSLLSQTRNENQYIVIITDRCTNVTRSIPTTKMSISYIAGVRFYNRLVHIALRILCAPMIFRSLLQGCFQIRAPTLTWRICLWLCMSGRPMLKSCSITSL